MQLSRNVSLAEGLRYRGRSTMLVFILHRISGLGMVLFLGLHILASFLARQPIGSRAGVWINSLYENWIFQIFIFFSFLFHSINGMRIIILDFWPQLIEHQREAIWLEWAIFLPSSRSLSICWLSAVWVVEEDRVNIRSVSGRGFNFETFMWLFTRLSGLAMYGLILVAFTGALLMGDLFHISISALVSWSTTPIPSHLFVSSASNILAWKTLFWQIMGSLMLLVAGAHGLHGVLSVLEDYLAGPRLRKVLRLLVFVAWLAICVIGGLPHFDLLGKG